MPRRRFHLFSGLCLSLLLLAPAAAQAFPAPEPMLPLQPSKVVIARSGAAAMAEEVLPVRHVNGRSFIDLLLPEDARDIVVRAENAEVCAVSMRTVPMPVGAGQELTLRMKTERSRLEGRVAALKAQAEALFKSPEQTVEKAEEIYAAMAEAKERMEAIDHALSRRPASKGAAKVATAELSGAGGASEIKVFCSFTLPSCGWSPSYAIDCVPGKDGMGTVGVRLEAEIAQQSGWDWKNAELVLVSSGAEGASPPELQKWLIGGEVEPLNLKSAVRSRSSFSGSQSARMAKNSDAAPQAQAVAGAGFAAWKPFVRGLTSGTTRVLIATDEWKEPLVWLARPLNRDARVFLTVRKEFDGKTFWPAGHARFSIEGVAAGDGSFAPAKGTATVSFGADPRVSLTAAAEPRKKGTEGFIGSKNTWEWAWTYTVRNGRDFPVRLRIERPLPESADSDVAVEHAEEPAAKVEDKAIVWELECAPQKSVAVKHAVKASAPSQKIIYPAAP